MAFDPARNSPPDGRDPESNSKIATRHAFSIRRAYREGAREYDSLPLDYHAFASAMVDRARRRLERTGVEYPQRRMGAALAQVSGADLYLAVACEIQVERAWQVFADRFLPRLRRFMLRRRISEDEADEILANLPGDLFVPPPGSRTGSRIGSYDGCGRLFYWLVTIVLRRHADLARAGKRTTSLEEENDRQDPGPRPATGTSFDPARVANVHESCRRIQDTVRAAWRKLTPRHLLVLRFKFLTRRTQKEMARALGVSEALVSQLLRDAVEKTRESVETQLACESGDTWPGADRLWATLCDVLNQKSALAEGEVPPRDLPTTEPTDHAGA